MSKFILRINAVVAGLVILAGCGGSNEKAMGPEATVEAFCRAVTAGQWSQAEALCDTVSMNSCALAIAESILADTVMTVEEVSKEDDRRVVSYTLAADGNSKTRKATLKKEEGAWRVERITDAN